MNEREFQFESAIISIKDDEVRLREAESNYECGVKKNNLDLEMVKNNANKEIARLKAEIDKAKLNLERAKLYSTWKEEEKEQGFEK